MKSQISQNLYSSYKTQTSSWTWTEEKNKRRPQTSILEEEKGGELRALPNIRKP